MKEKIISIIKNKEIWLYLIFGILTTLINIFIFYICTNFIFINIFDENLNITISNIVAFILAVIFAFITNKKYVFNSVSHDISNLLKQFISFMYARVFTFFVDLVGILIFVNLLLIDKMIAKIFFNVVVIVLNYVFSKYYIFKNQKGM